MQYPIVIFGDIPHPFYPEWSPADFKGSNHYIAVVKALIEMEIVC